MTADIPSTIEHGYALAIDNGQADPTLPQAVWELLIEAGDTLKRLPDRELSWLRSAMRCHHPDVVRETIEEFAAAVAKGGWDKARVKMGPPSSGAISRLDQVLTWPQAIQSKARRRDVQVVYCLAMGVRVALIRKRFGVGRRTVYDIRDRSLASMCRWLEAQMVNAA